MSEWAVCAGPSSPCGQAGVPASVDWEAGLRALGSWVWGPLQAGWAVSLRSFLPPARPPVSSKWQRAEIRVFLTPIHSWLGQTPVAKDRKQVHQCRVCPGKGEKRHLAVPRVLASAEPQQRPVHLEKPRGTGGNRRSLSLGMLCAAFLWKGGEAESFPAPAA